MQVYLDNAATSRIKPKTVFEAMEKFFYQNNSNPGRGAYELSLNAGREIIEARTVLKDFFGMEEPSEVIFTQNITIALNMALKGLLQKGDHVLITGLEHNGVVRPLTALRKERGISFEVIPSDQEGRIDLEAGENLIKANTKLIVATHASNVTGTLVPIKELGELAKKHQLDFIIDTAQTAGLIPLDFKELNATALAFTGHKHLLGPTGIGGFCVGREDAKRIKPLYEGGTGSISDQEIQPDFLPDKFESGTLNTLGIMGLKAAVEYIQRVGLEQIQKKERELTEKLLTGLKILPKIKIYGPQNSLEQIGTVGINLADVDNAELSLVLDKKFGIMTRPGLHCAPLAHKTIGSFPEGVLRISIGHFTAEEEIDYCLKALKKITEKL